MQLRDVEPGTKITVPMFNDGKTYTVLQWDFPITPPDIDIMADDGTVLTAPCQLLVELKDEAS